MQSRTKSLSSKQVATAALLAALALIFGYIEFLIPISLAAPGIKLGIANIVIVIALYKLGWKWALPINVVRVLLSALLFGSMFSALYSLAGALLSFTVMALLKACGKFSIVGVSMAGGVAHNVGQLLVACFAMQTFNVLYYYPVLLISGLATGIGIGILATLVLNKLR
ncbi:MAG: Gx transporter family protein [Bacillota bacterium]|nr:Gx transporter family protein [Bacillota bacterium]